jgi:hypothetical protein
MLTYSFSGFSPELRFIDIKSFLPEKNIGQGRSGVKHAKRGPDRMPLAPPTGSYCAGYGGMVASPK